MAIYNKEKLIPVSAVPSILNELTGIRRCMGTIYVWMKKGCRTYDGRVVRLQFKKKLGQRFTTLSKIKQFIREVG